MYPRWRRWLFIFVLFFSSSLFPLFAQGQVALPVEGNGSVGGNSGAFTYTVPIVVPPGRNALAPQIALSYNSSGGNGFLGVGWDLPIGYVMRSTKNGVDYNCVSSATKPCFVFMLGGASSELIPRTDWCSDCYGAEIEGGFVKFRFVNNSYWQAIDKTGTTYTFGQNPTTKYSQQSGPPGTFKWALETVTDTHNNTISYSYFNDQGEIYPETVDYQANHIIFNRENRTDKPTLYGPNFAVTTAYRLSGIDVYSNWNGTTGTLNRKYVLGYCGTTGVTCTASGTERSILGKVTQYGSDGVTALPDIKLDWQNVQAGWTNPSWSGSSPALPIGDQCLAGDLNGDGKDDLWCQTASGSGSWDVRLSMGSGWTNPPVWSGPTIPSPVGDRCFTGDLDGNGKTDFWCEATSGGGTWDVYLSTGTSWTHGVWSGSSPAFPVGTQCFTGDLNGDGKTDFWCQTGSSTGSWDVRLSTGSGWSAQTPWSGPAPALPVGNQCLTGDLNGDGRTDFWCESGSGSGSWNVAISTGTSWSTPPPWSGSTPSLPVGNQCFTGDLNGDGKTDFWCETGESTGQWDVRLSTGSSWSSGTWAGPSIGLPVKNGCLTGDLDGDGKSDFWCQTESATVAWDVRLSMGNSWLTKQLTGISVSQPGSWSTKASISTERNFLTGGVINGIFYAVGGTYQGGNYARLLEAYDPRTNIWTTKALMPTARFKLGAGVVNGILYVVGGYNGSRLATVEAYNPATDTWTTKAPMPTPRSSLAVGVVNGTLYAVGGFTTNTSVNTVEAYDPATDTWTTKAPMPTPRSGLAVGVLNGILYAVGGWNCSGNPCAHLATVEAYDPATDTWTTKAPMPTPRSNLAVGVVNGILYAVGGENSVAVSAVEVYDPASTTWVGGPSMQEPRTRFAAGVVNGVFYAAGGEKVFSTPLITTEGLNIGILTDSCLSGDLNGDGKTDFWCYQSGGNWGVTLMNTGMPDLLTGISNGIGGHTSITYKPSSADWTSTDTGWNLPMVNQNVASISTCDNYNGTSCVAGANLSTTNYDYKGAYYNAPAREFRGYASVKATNAENNNTTETFYHQGNGVTVAADSGSDLEGYTAGRPYRIIANDNTGVTRSKKEFLYTPDEGGTPYFTPLQQENNWFCDTASACEQTESIYTYDHDNGNPTREDHKGNLSTTSDDRTVARSFSPNTATWILGLPTSEVIYQGISTASANRVAQTDFYYDESTSCSTSLTSHTSAPPTKGDLTTIVRWLNIGGASPETQMVYDTHGNVTCKRDANGNATSISYDITGTFPKVVTGPSVNQNQFQTATQYYGIDEVEADNGLYGQVKSVTDPNGKVTTTTYDQFGRKIQVSFPDGSSTTWNYPCVSATGCTPDPTNLFGVVGSQYVKTTTAGLSSWVYFDGLGRTIRGKKTGPDSKLIRVDTDYNNLGQIESTTLPYFEGQGTNGLTTYTYDVIGRQQQITHPDHTAQNPVRTLFCYSLWSSGTIDPKNHLRWETRDAYGRLRNVYEFTGTYSACPTNDPTPDAYANTTYQYDVLGNLIYATDTTGKIASIQYDSLSRKIHMNDPDVGDVSYVYDGLGNLIRQTDAKGQEIVFEYDALNRVKTKTTSNKPTLTITKPGTGAGNVTSTPVGITCGSTCFVSFTSGTSVTLTAAAATGATFAGFGSGCTSATTSCTFTITANTTVTATFNDVQAPTAPSTLTATTASSSQINLSWTASTDNNGVSGYWIERCQGTACSNFARVNLSLVTSTNYSDTGLAAGTSYRYRIQAADAAANLSTYSNISNATTFSSTSALMLGGGYYHNCALLSNGTASCWGDNSFGQLGNGQMTNSNIPLSVSGVANATAVAAGYYHGCALFSDGTAKCWGNNAFGELGNGTTTDSNIPVAVSGITSATKIAGGFNHTCALLSNGTVNCWGYNGFGQLGNATTTSSSTPAVVSGITTATAIATGSYHTCALLSNGTVNCWGYNGFGQLGNATTTSSSTPVVVSGITNATAIVAGYYHTCALLSNGTVKCWGYNSYGQLGNGTTNTALTPVSVNGITTATALAAGHYHTCAVLSGALKCWGYNLMGQLGNGTFTDSNIPVAVSGITSGIALTAGYDHTCALLLNGTAKCWGHNSFGQLGDGTNNVSPTPVSVSGISPDTMPPTISSVVSGSITSNGATITWTTHETSDTQVEYGTTTSYGSSTTLNTAMVTNHSATLSGLSASTLYHYRVKSKDAAGNLATSADFTFTTSAGTAGRDLIMTLVSGPASGQMGGSIIISNTVNNQGGSAAGFFEVRLMLSTDQTITSSDTVLVYRNVNSLAAGASNSANTTVTLPNGMTPGTYYLGAIVDIQNLVSETNETNNSLAGNTIAITIGEDLVITAVSGPSSGQRGTNIIITNTAKNQGTGQAGFFEVRLFLSPDQTITSSDTVLGYRNVNSLAAGASNSANTTVTLPSGLAPGTYYIGAIADVVNLVPEDNETNNSLAGNTINVTP